MTKEEKQKAIAALKLSTPVKAVTSEEFKDYIRTLNKIIDWLEQGPCDVFDEHGDYKYPSDIELAEPNMATSMPYEDVVSRKWLVEALEAKGFGLTDTDYNIMIHLIRDTAPSVQPKIETVTEFADRCRECGKQKHCKDCRWWKDSDGIYRRGIEAESICPINSKKVWDGNGYCYMFEPQLESEE